METVKAGDARRLAADEELARAILVPYLSGQLVALASTDDPTPDFALYRDGRPAGWLEVTTATDEATHRVSANLRRRGQRFFSDRLTRSWMVIFRRTADLSRLDRERLVDALVPKEQILARDTFGQADPRVRRRFASEDMRDYPTMRAILAEYDVADTYDLPTHDGQPRVLLNHEGHASFVDPAHINRLVEAKLDAKQKQLEGRSGERHLFIWVDVYERSGAAVAMGGYDEPELPDELPSFPPWGTAVWLMGTVSPPRLWHARRDMDAWEVFNVDLSKL